MCAINDTVVKAQTEHSAFCSSVKTDMGAAGAVSRLYIANANKKDSGNYSCALANVAAVTMREFSLHPSNQPCSKSRLKNQSLLATDNGVW
ncbi:Uncharacterized protein DBV15_10483 [Temnothorax longispinosus]|uniref:Ig-like domain-containing protein n=1 Tax=Temnothorax longispinosus TaxID=300112 RepID=A0A4S2L5X2_9HYME|nr:Uncharacterized protein DBV15_10483 [Temnothorax longispinosus]